MGLFDFLKPNKNSMNNPMDNPKLRPTMIKGMADQLVTRCNNLKAVGRETEAKAIAEKFLMDSFRTCEQKEYLESTEMLSAVTYSAIRLGEAKMGKQFLDRIINAHEAMRVKNPKSGGSVMDLTQPYIDAGKLAHQMSESGEDEYRCFRHAAEAEPPPGCKNPASNRQKAIAHNFAYSISAVTRMRDRANSHEWGKREKWHDVKRREYAPECDWDDSKAMLAWLRGEEPNPAQQKSLPLIPSIKATKAQWIVVNSFGGSMTYVDRASIERNGELICASVRYALNPLGTDKRNGKPVKEMIMREEYDTSGGRFRVHSLQFIYADSSASEVLSLEPSWKPATDGNKKTLEFLNAFIWSPPGS
jgi:hypothetical protein